MQAHRIILVSTILALGASCAGATAGPQTQSVCAADAPSPGAQGRTFVLQPHRNEMGIGSVGACGPLQIWACPSNCKISPITGNSLDEAEYSNAERAGDYRSGNEVWDGQRHRAVVFAGRNDTVGIQLVLQNTEKEALTDLAVSVQGIWQDSGMSFRSVEAAKVSLFWEWCCKDKTGTYYPDALLPVDGPLSIPNPADKIPGQTVQALYMDLYVPGDTAPGLYTIALQIEGASVPASILPIDLTVWDFTLPQTPSFLANLCSYNLPGRGADGDRRASAVSAFGLAGQNRLNLKVLPHGQEGRLVDPGRAPKTNGKRKDRQGVRADAFADYYLPMQGSVFSGIAGQDRGGRPLCVYGGTNKVEASNVANRLWSIEAWLSGADSIVSWVGFGPDEAYGRTESAGEAIFYLGGRFGYNGTYGSLRMKAFRDGQQDVECLILLARQLGATRKEMAGLLSSVADLQGAFVVEHPEAADAISYSRMSPDDLARLRRVIGYNLHLLAQQKAVKARQTTGTGERQPARVSNAQ